MRRWLWLRFTRDGREERAAARRYEEMITSHRVLRNDKPITVVDRYYDSLRSLGNERLMRHIDEVEAGE